MASFTDLQNTGREMNLKLFWVYGMLVEGICYLFVITGTLNVAFSVGSGISGTYGPFNTDKTLNFNKVLTNVGNAYSPHTGTSL